jgi:NADPH:quinone reductase-like Zn-dependent oxidoreductase
MQAVVYTKYGSPEVLEVHTLPTPQPKSDEVLIRVRAAAVNPVDFKIRQGQTWFLTGFSFPRQLGADLSGEVAEVGEKVSRFKPGDQVYAMISPVKGGSYAEYAVAPEKLLARKPSNLSHEEAAAVPLAALTALQGLRDEGRLQAGQRVLINGSSGGVGTFAVQLAKVLGAHVTGVCSTRNLDLTKELGADRVIDYTQQEVTDLPGGSFDLIFDTVGSLPYDKGRLLLTREGTYVTTQPSPYAYTQSFLSRLLPGGRRIRPFLNKPSVRDLQYLTRLLEEEKLRPVIDSVFPLREIRQAHERSESHHAAGKIVLTAA